MTFVYLHGFASGPASKKATLFRERLAALGVLIAVPDLNEGRDGFEGLTVTRMIGAAEAALAGAAGPAVLIGSSLGGYAAALLAARDPRVAAVVLLAPAFDFGARLAARLRREDPEAFERGWFETQHYAYGRMARIGTEIVADALRLAPFPDVHCPAVILHGWADESVPYQLSERFAAQRPNVRLVQLDDGHELARSFEPIWTEARAFLAPWLPAPAP